MDKFLVHGGKPLKGKIEISGAKNSALPCLAATLLSSETVTLHNVPYVKDLITFRRLLEDLGATVLTPELRTHKVNAGNVQMFEAPYELVKTMRASVLALGPLLARFGQAKVSLPGGCAIGTRPIDLHLKAFEQLGASVSLESGDVVARAPKGRSAPTNSFDQTERFEKSLHLLQFRVLTNHQKLINTGPASYKHTMQAIRLRPGLRLDSKPANRCRSLAL